MKSRIFQVTGVAVAFFAAALHGGTAAAMPQTFDCQVKEVAYCSAKSQPQYSNCQGVQVTNMNFKVNLQSKKMTTCDRGQCNDVDIKDENSRSVPAAKVLAIYAGSSYQWYQHIMKIAVTDDPQWNIKGGTFVLSRVEPRQVQTYFGTCQSK